MTRTKALVFVIVMLTLSNGYVFYRTLDTAGQVRGQVSQIAAEGRRIGIQRRFIFESCERLNILRVEDNISHFADYRVFRVVLIESRATQRRLSTPRQKLFQRRFLTQLAEAVREKTWTPRTNCRKAVNEHGAAFRPPQPVSFARRLPVPSALTLRSSDFHVPFGS